MTEERNWRDANLASLWMECRRCAETLRKLRGRL